jgi:hypothetical protein
MTAMNWPGNDCVLFDHALGRDSRMDKPCDDCTSGVMFCRNCGNAKWDELRNEWLAFFTTMRLKLMALDGNTSREIGGIVQQIITDGPSKHDWPDTGAALFFHNDPELWHELANSRKK